MTTTEQLTKAEKELILRESKVEFKRIQDRIAEYNNEVEYYREQGYRPQYCIHGVNMWNNDFDGACAGCEYGDSVHTLEMMTFEDVMFDMRGEYKQHKALSSKKIGELNIAISNLIPFIDKNSGTVDKVLELHKTLRANIMGRWA